MPRDARGSSARTLRGQRRVCSDDQVENAYVCAGMDGGQLYAEERVEFVRQEVLAEVTVIHAKAPVELLTEGQYCPRVRMR